MREPQAKSWSVSCCLRISLSPFCQCPLRTTAYREVTDRISVLLKRGIPLNTTSMLKLSLPSSYHAFGSYLCCSFLVAKSSVGHPHRAPLVWLSANAATVCACRTLCGRCFHCSGVNTHGTAGARGNLPVALLKVDLEFFKKPHCVPWITIF